MVDILDKAEGRTLTGALKLGYDAITIEGSAEYVIADKTMDIVGSASYAHELATIKVGGSVSTIEVVSGKYEDSKKVACEKLGAYVSAESTSIVSGATLGLAWNATDLRKVDSSDTNKIGVVTASAKIAF